ncbi:serine/threonine-protein phosphatase 2A regulatory subunit B'' subunit gamma-like isoform X2 [Aethina tumida]|uniref:serine/threonine-protein phosphatase 2A regulatory subunit B'' subunit gamma-like isoform X2 n=1 Tax=Aethina tumida TaxID=116153 RepID=UPI0021496B0E|nr:serine/threonine-protein phosphatase 2A regulatory subunit B'' subunit gamma-like isoform X2 [Aethina tumida]
MHTKSCPHSLESQLKLFHSKHTQNAALMDLKSLLKSKVKPVSREELIQTEDEYFKMYLEEWGKKQEPCDGIPKFFNKLPKEHETLRRKLRDESRSNQLSRKNHESVHDSELRDLWVLLEEHQSLPDELITYSDFQKVSALLGPKVKRYFTPSVFARLQQGDPQGRISNDLLDLRLEELSKELQEQNWFSAPSALRIYGHYLNLDRDHNGMLSKSELAGYGTGSLTQPFLDRVFQTCLTYGGEMDYKTYLDLVLALENRSEPQALAFLFRILDIKGCGYLDAFTLHFFFRAIQDQLKAHGAEPVSFEDVKDELFDMVKPEHPDRITLSDLQNCGQGETFVSILIEFHGFWNHENREAVSSEPSQD